MRFGVVGVLWLVASVAHAQPERLPRDSDEPPAPPPMGWIGELTGPRSRAELDAPDGATRAAAAARLGRSGEAGRAVDALLARLDEEHDARVRAALLEALARRGDPRAVVPIAEHLTEWERADRELALRTIGVIGGERAIRVLVDWLAASDVGDEAMNGLVRIGAASLPHLIGALEIPISAVRAAIALGRIGDARATHPLVSRLRAALPPARVAMIRALGAIADERATPALVRMLSDSEPGTVAAALWALSRVAGAEHAQPVASLADRGTSEQRAAALTALVVMDPVAAAPRLEAVIVDPETSALLRAAAVEALLARPSAPLVPTLVALLETPQRLAAAEALSRVEGSTAAVALLEAARADPDRALDPALALALRRHAEELDSDLRLAIREHLRADPSPRGAVLSALARDGGIRPRVVAGLASPDPVDRASAGLAAQLLGDGLGSDRARITEALVSEPDPAAFRALALAALASRASVDPAQIDSRSWEPATAPEALWVTAANLDRAGPRVRRRARRAMRRALRSAQPRVRAGAAMALAIAHDTGAWRALVAALGDEHDAVRLAVARALEALAVPAASSAIAARARVERDDRVRRALVAVAASPGRRPPPPFRRGDAVLHVRISTAPGLSRGADLAVDVLLPDGRWLSTLALSSGEVLVPDLAEGEAEVQVRLDP
ncbi:MAG: HEAT repeat domain-containing protein [Sandaracinaceae bacterium]|nr:HEAT repeat domain-containing protein [Sandaracinaceae bacterium]